ncbi:MAG: inverse autotransporter beta domain-containing protein [Candidatus Omnitrophica bacterium]|nr:inverse autotransporter beta domain-containing protein [Candidatus Omnitrophota bacterium]
MKFKVPFSSIFICAFSASALSFIVTPGFADNVPDTISTNTSQQSLASQGQESATTLSSVLGVLGNDTLSYMHNGLWSDAPDWVKRTEWNVNFDRVNGTEYDILTTQPLWQSVSNENTVLTQWSYEHYKLYDIDRDTINGGLGYRRLLLDNTLLLGINNMYDYEVSYDHARSSIGGDAKWGPLDFYSNYYYRLNGVKIVKGAEERVNNGYDLGLGLPLPYLPWAKVNVKYYDWYGIYAPNTMGGEYSGEIILTPNLSLVIGTRGKTPETTRQDNYVMLSFHFGGKSKSKGTLFTQPVSSQMFETRDLTEETLDKINRENRIMLERVVRNPGGITVVIKKG